MVLQKHLHQLLSHVKLNQLTVQRLSNRNGAVIIDIELDYYQGDNVSIEVTDINGKIIQSQPIQLNRGLNNLEINLNQISSEST